MPLGEFLDVPARVGTYFLTRADRRVGAVVVNPPPDESVLDRFSAGELRRRLRASRTVIAPDAASWPSMAFSVVARRSLVEPALVIALLMLIIESMALGARTRSRSAA